MHQSPDASSIQITCSSTCIDLGFSETSVAAASATWGVAEVGNQEPQQAVGRDGATFVEDPAGLMMGRFGLSVPGSLKQVILSLFLL